MYPRFVTDFGIKEERERILNFLASHPSGICSAEKEVVRDIMLKTDGRMTLEGMQFDIEAKRLGGGVYRLSLKSLD